MPCQGVRMGVALLLISMYADVLACLELKLNCASFSFSTFAAIPTLGFAKTRHSNVGTRVFVDFCNFHCTAIYARMFFYRSSLRGLEWLRRVHRLRQLEVGFNRYRC